MHRALHASTRGRSALTAATPAMFPACPTATRSGRPPLPRNVRNATGSPLGPVSRTHSLPGHAPALTFNTASYSSFRAVRITTWAGRMNPRPYRLLAQLFLPKLNLFPQVGVELG